MNIKNYHLTGHDLIAFKIQNHEVFAEIGVKSQKHFFPLASGPIHIRGAIGSTGSVHCTVGNLKSHPSDGSCGTVHYDDSTVAGMSGSPVMARVRGQQVVVGIHLGTWACEEGFLNVAAGYHVLQRLRRACGKSKSLCSPAAYEYLKHKVKQEIYSGKTESPPQSELQSVIDDSDYQGEEVLNQAKRGGARKAAHRAAVSSSKAANNDPEEEEARYRASLGMAAELQGFNITAEKRRQPFGAGPSMLTYRPPAGRNWADMSDDDEDDGCYEAPNKIAVTVGDPTLGSEKPKVESVATFLLEMAVTHPDWALDKHIIASYSNVGLNAISQIPKYLVGIARVGYVERAEKLRTTGTSSRTTFGITSTKGTPPRPK